MTCRNRGITKRIEIGAPVTCRRPVIVDVMPLASVKRFSMPKEWFIRKNGKTYGPISTAKLKATSQSGKLTTEDKVSNSKDGPWHPVTRIKGLTPKTKGAEKQRQRSSRPKTRKTKPAVESPPPPNPTPPVAAPYVPPQSAAPHRLSITWCHNQIPALTHALYFSTRRTRNRQDLHMHFGFFSACGAHIGFIAAKPVPVLLCLSSP